MQLEYIGNELELFEHAKNWKNYFKSSIAPYIIGDVLEVGAGLGGTTKVLCNTNHNSWLCLEPDEELAKQIHQKIEQKEIPSFCKVKNCFSFELSESEKFDTILYIDVIEHIEKDYEELKTAQRLLKPGGKLIILVPAFNFLFSPFDKAIGHFRRYQKDTLLKVIPKEFKKKELFYLDSTGFMASVVNKYFLKQPYPSLKQVSFWDTYMVQMSKITDVVTRKSFGKSLIGIWEKN